MKLFNLSFCLLVLFSLNLAFVPIRAADAEVDEDAVVNEETGNAEELQPTTEGEAEEEAVDSLSSPFAKTNILFVQPESADLPAGRLVKLLVGFQNNGTSSFVVEGIDGSFRFPQDFSYYIQNFSYFQFNKEVLPERESTFEYMFTPSETFAQRQFGLNINVRYRDQDGKIFVNTVFNETVSIVEPDEGFDGETFFLYIFLAAIVVLLGLAGQHFLSVFRRKGKIPRFGANGHKQYSNGVQNGNGKDIDFEWIPKEHLQNKSPRTSPRKRNGTNKVSSGNSSNDEQ